MFTVTWHCVCQRWNHQTLEAESREGAALEAGRRCPCGSFNGFSDSDLRTAWMHKEFEVYTITEAQA